MHQALTQVSFFFCSFSVYAHPHLPPMHLCAHVHQPSTSQQHICIHASTGSSKFFLLSFLSAHSLISTSHARSTHNMHSCVPLFTNHLHLLAQPICIYTFTDTSKFFFCLFSVYAHPHLHPICRCL